MVPGNKLPKTRAMERRDRTHWLIYFALAYSLSTFGLIFGSVGAPMGPLSLSIPLLVIYAPLAAIGGMLVLRAAYWFHWIAITAFVLWILGTAFVQALIFAQASASV